MKILVTGLCLSRNLGGPAMGLTLVEQLRSRIEGIDFMFAVDPNAFEQEKKWADYYGLKIVCRDNIISYIVKTNILLRFVRRLYNMSRGKHSFSLKNLSARSASEIHNDFMAAYEACAAVVDMQGISYVGDGVRGPLEGIISYSNLYYANKLKKPFIHFIQSFGPFDDWKVRFFAMKDFNQVDFVPARGKKSAQYCRSIVKNPEKVYDFPDSAILLPPADSTWTKNYLTNLDLSSKNYFVLSPSSVIYHMKNQDRWSVGDQHVDTFALIASNLLSKNENVLFLPHMYSENKSECDREVCRKILQRLQDEGTDFSRCKIIEDDLDVWQAKALISNSKAAIVSRYHALVAAISTGVPVVTIGWNVKYLDLLEYYGLDSMAIDARSATPSQISINVFEKLITYAEDNTLFEKMRACQQENAAKVECAFDMLASWVVKNAG